MAAAHSCKVPVYPVYDGDTISSTEALQFIKYNADHNMDKETRGYMFKNQLVDPKNSQHPEECNKALKAILVDNNLVKGITADPSSV